MRYLNKIANKSFGNYSKKYLQQAFDYLVATVTSNSWNTELKYKIAQVDLGLINELKIESQKLSQLPAIH